MSLFSRMKHRGFAALATAFPSLGERLAAGYRAERQEEGIPWTAATTPPAAATIALVTTAGVHHRDQPPYDMHDPDGDPSFRELDLERSLDSLMITHDYYDHKDADRDLNVVLPVERLRELVASGEVGAVARLAYGFMGHITGRHLETLKRRTAPEVAARLKRAGVGAVLLAPG
ncbi:MAG: glycine/sarcosine/betaine reductase selenoprotein B family protein [Candidatus Methylomirabilia bacterium]